MVTVNELDTLEVFNDFSSEQKKKIAAISHKKKIAADNDVYMSKYRASRLFVVISGQVALQAADDDTTAGLSFGTLKDGQLFGGASILKLQRYTITASCRTDTELLVIESNDLFKEIAGDYELGYRVMRKVAEVYLDRYMAAKEKLHMEMKTSPTTIMAAPG